MKRILQCLTLSLVISSLGCVSARRNKREMQSMRDTLRDVQIQVELIKTKMDEPKHIYFLHQDNMDPDTRDLIQSVPTDELLQGFNALRVTTESANGLQLRK